MISVDKMMMREHREGRGKINVEMAWDGEENGCTFYSFSFLNTIVLRRVCRNRELKSGYDLTYAASLKCKLAENTA